MPWLFPVALWALGTLALGGDLGRYFDDYTTTMRSPVTGEVDLGEPFDQFPFFWRPLHWLLVFHLLTWFHDALWIPHALTAAMHGVTAILLFTLLRRLLRSPHAAAGAALLFAAYPMNHEVTIWIASTTNAIATSLWIVMAHLYISYLRAGAGPWRTLAVAPIAFAIPCFNEQASAGILVLPLLGLFLAPRAAPPFRRVWMALWPAALASAIVLLYIVLLRATAPPGYRGSAGSYLALGDLAPRLRWLGHQLGVTHYRNGLTFALGPGWRTGLEALPALAWAVWTAVLAAASVPWFLRWRRTPLRPALCPPTDEQTPRAAPAPLHPLIVLAFGVALLIAAWLPLLVIVSQIAEPRMGYFPSVGLAVILAALIDLAAAAAVRLRLESVFKPALAVVVALASWYGAVCLLGYHKSFQNQARADIAQAARLRELVPDPPPGTVFVPVHVAAPTAGSGAVLRRGISGWLWATHAATALLHETYRRTDLHATFFNPWVPVPLTEIDARGFVFAPPDRESQRFSWDVAVPFIVDADERTHLIRELVIEAADGSITTVHPPLVARAAAAGADDTVNWTVKPPP